MNTSRAIAISCTGVSKSFPLFDAGNSWRLLFNRSAQVGAFKALDGITLEVEKGKFVGVLGRNGAGKSTLLRVLGGVYAANTGTVEIEGAISALYELGVVANSELTGRQYADRLLSVHGFSRRERLEMISDIHEFSELEKRFDDPVLTYSAGMGARLYFATATAGNYSVYLVDEVLSVGDQHFQSKCWRRLRERLACGASGILVTHDWPAVLKLCETAHVLDHGKVSFSGAAALATRFYLYGSALQNTYKTGIAKFVGTPTITTSSSSPQDLSVTCTAEIHVDTEVGVTFAIERLQPGFGWETMLMSRSVTPVGEKAGTYEVIVEVPALPLEPGAYQIAVHLVSADPDAPGQFNLLDGFGWLDGNGISLEIDGVPEQSMAIPAQWALES
ncbi:MAG: ATP-binding cassette domain-containing protein [Bacteroidota bacterium]|nr:ATP-binding cassette domain-containing protein [Bacteroidota bacterium]